MEARREGDAADDESVGKKVIEKASEVCVLVAVTFLAARLMKKRSEKRGGGQRLRPINDLTRKERKEARERAALDT